jgi:AcrR family transcriptional regulator
VTRPDTRAAILDAVLMLLGAPGQRVSYEAIAQEAGVSRQTVYAHFPTRADLLIAAVDRARDSAGVESATQSVLDAPTARAALDAMVDLHAALVSPLVRAHVAVEFERAMDSDVDTAFTRRSSGRRRLAQLVATRLKAEGDLAAPWTVSSARDLIATLTSGTSTALFLRDAGWTEDELRERLLVLLQRSLLEPTTREGT